MIVWSQFSNFNQNFGIIRVIMKPHIFLLETNRKQQPQTLWPFSLFLRNDAVFKCAHRCFNTPSRKRQTFLLFAALELGRPLWPHRQTEYGRCDTTWPSSLEKPWTFCIFPRTFTFKSGAGALQVKSITDLELPAWDGVECSHGNRKRCLRS